MKLKAAARLINDCAQEHITIEVFLADYDSFYMRYALDGHESDNTELALFQKYAPEIALHKAVWDEIEVKVTADELIARPDIIQAGFISNAEALTRLKDLAAKHADVLGLT